MSALVSPVAGDKPEGVRTIAAITTSNAADGHLAVRIEIEWRSPYIVAEAVAHYIGL